MVDVILSSVTIDNPNLIYDLYKKENIDINAYDSTGKNLLLFLAEKGMYNSIEKFLRLKVLDINCKNNRNENALCIAIRHHKNDVCKLLVSCGISMCSNANQHPVMVAVENNNIEIIPFLLCEGPYKNMLLTNTSAFQRFLEYCLENGCIHLVRNVYTHKDLDRCYSKGANRLLRYILDVNMDEYKFKHYILQKEVPSLYEKDKCKQYINTVDWDGNNMLQNSLQLDNFRLFNFLLDEFGIHIDKLHKNDRGETVLDIAIKHKHIEIIKQLIRQTFTMFNKVDFIVNKINDNNRCNTNLFNCLAPYLTNVIVYDNENVLFYSTKITYITKLLQLGSPTDIINTQGNTVLLHSIFKRLQPNIIKLFINKCDVNHRNNHGHTALYVALNTDYWEIVDMLIESGADINIKDNNGMTILEKFMDVRYNTNKNTVRKLLSLQVSHFNYNMTVINSVKDTPELYELVKDKMINPYKKRMYKLISKTLMGMMFDPSEIIKYIVQ